jgi:hypothetical protein
MRASKLGQRKGLGDVIVGPQLQRRHLVKFILARREHDDRHVILRLAQPLEHPQAALLGQRDVEQHQIGRAGLDARRAVSPSPMTSVR